MKHIISILFSLLIILTVQAQSHFQNLQNQFKNENGGIWYYRLYSRTDSITITDAIGNTLHKTGNEIKSGTLDIATGLVLDSTSGGWTSNNTTNNNEFAKGQWQANGYALGTFFNTGGSTKSLLLGVQTGSNNPTLIGRVFSINAASSATAGIFDFVTNTGGTGNISAFRGDLSATAGSQYAVSIVSQFKQTGTANAISLRVSPNTITRGAGNKVVWFGTSAGALGIGAQTSYFDIDDTGTINMPALLGRNWAGSYSKNGMLRHNIIGSIVVARREEDFGSPVALGNYIRFDKSARTTSFVLSPDTIPIITVGACTRDNINSAYVDYPTPVTDRLYGEAGTDTSILKKTVNGLPYIRLTLDSAQSCTAMRTELSPKGVSNRMLSDSVLWIGEVKLLPTTWVKDSTPVAILQLHGGSTYYTDANSPPFDIEVINDSLFANIAYNTAVDSGAQNATRVGRLFFLSKITFGKPFAFVAQLKLAAYPKTSGFVKIWLDDRLVLSYTGTVGYQLNNAPYYKTGIYKWLFYTGANYHVAAGVQSDKIVTYIGDARYGNGNSSYEDIRPSYAYTDSLSVANTPVTPSATQTLTNKVIAAGSNTITGLTNSNLSGSAGITNANLASGIDASKITTGTLPTAQTAALTGDVTKSAGSNPTIVTNVPQAAMQASGIARQVLYSHIQLTNTTSSTSENTVFTGTIPAGTIGANGSLQFNILFSTTNSANLKTLKVKINGTAILNHGVTTSASNRDIGFISNRNSTSSQIGGNSGGGATGYTLGVSSAVISTFSFNTAADMTVTVTLQNANSTETMALEDFQVIAIN